MADTQTSTLLTATEGIATLTPTIIRIETTTEMNEGEYILERPKYTGTVEVTEEFNGNKLEQDTHTETQDKLKRKVIIRKGRTPQMDRS